MKKENYPKILLVVFLLLWVILAISPTYRDVWALENAISFVFILILILTYKKFKFSNTSYTLMFIFMVLHSIGAHYSYAETPLGFWVQDFFNFERNHFDRLVHFSFGLLFAYPVRDLFMKMTSATGRWSYFIPVELTLSMSAIFEIIEWGAVALVDSSAGAIYLGMQGDIFDAQKDMILALSGAIISMSFTAFKNRKK